jgi:hypothetical protein
MTKTRRSEITIETHKVTIIHRHGKRTTGFCPRCESENAFATVDEIAALLQIDAAEMEALAKDGNVHFAETTEDNPPLICSGSLEGLKTKKQ